MTRTTTRPRVDPADPLTTSRTAPDAARTRMRTHRFAGSRRLTARIRRFLTVPLTTIRHARAHRASTATARRRSR